MDPLVRRIAERIEAASERAARLRACLPTAVQLLAERGANRIVLFGSLAHGHHLHAESDVDLAAWGMTPRSVLIAGGELEDLFEARVDLVRAEDASPSLLARISADGIVLRALEP